MYDFITIGDCGQDIFLELDKETANLHDIRHERTQICLNYASKLPVLAKHDCVGGNAANVAVAMARMGYNTAIYTHVGSDHPGIRIEHELHKNHIALDYLQEDKNSETNYNTVLNLNGERTILVYHLKRQYILPKMKAAHWVYLTSMSEGFERILPHLLNYVKEHKSKLVYQPGTYQLRFGREHINQLLHLVHVISMNKEEAEHFLGEKDAVPVPELLKKMAKLGCANVLITDGGNGSYAYDGLHIYHLNVPEGIPRVDTTGAGDSFSAGFIGALAAGQSMSEALRWGQAEAGSVIGQFGAQTGLLYKKQLEHYLADNPDLKAEVIQ